MEIRAKLLVAAAVLVPFVGVAGATVTQVGGIIIPQTNRLQIELDGQGETLHAILDAAELPQVFLPNTDQPVVFRDIAEGAGYENSFGWYNIGDDVLTPAGRDQNLHPILGCGVPMQNHAYDPSHTRHHHGNPAYYFQNAEPGDQISVDFGAELAAGRYKGGFIGFYLITPEDNPSSGNCGDFKLDNSNNSYFGRIYFTEKDLNDDGDFVHHLVYASNSAPDRFYFGFEDLFRGGDNDFEDMLIRVDGLTPPCVPTVEICDGIDNDCDGLVDADDPDLTEVGEPCLCDGVDLTCVDGPFEGACQTGETVCLDGALQCTSIVGPTAELCNGEDDNCNGIIDDNPSDVGDACDGPDADLCQDGVTICVDGTVTCDDDSASHVELCNGHDDDCDGIIDEDVVDAGGTCGSSVGVCTPGVYVCVDGALECEGETTGGDELCNGLDDDCNGVVDDNPLDVGQPCGTTDVGECEYGETICVGGSLQCAGEIGPVPETCNLLDDDCDGEVDEYSVDVGNPCGSSVGVCEPGIIICTATGPSCEGATEGTDELCNGLDDDCNGIIDDDPAGTDEPCGDSEGLCEPGLTKCINGGLQCVGGFGGTTETCNGFDDDCDGEIDEGDLCDGGVCVDGECTSPCVSGEFPCPIGQVCNGDGYCVPDPCFDVVCPAGPEGELEVCREGTCLPVCDTVDCPGALVCRPRDGSCGPDNCNFLGCAEGEVCVVGECIADPCRDVDCAADDLCRDGQCFDSCAGIECGVAERCHDGVCTATGCDLDCPAGQVCQMATGVCVDDPCRGISCEAGQVCDPQTGGCIIDPCLTTRCPEGQVCDFGDCFFPDDLGLVDAGPDKELVVAGGGGGCSAGGEGGLGPLLVAFGALALIAARRRRLLLVAAIAALMTNASCGWDPFCLNCDQPGAGGDAGTADAGIDARPDAAACDQGVVTQEICDGLDNDCDGLIDEDFDLDDDLANCGACGNQCAKPGAITDCQSGSCAIIGCFPGQLDLNGDAEGPYDDSDGCEYKCFVSNGGVEACDGLDNDCDGLVDEDTDFDNDDANCGGCGKVCSAFKATSHCAAGTCVFDPQTDCEPGFLDINGNQQDGCEYACTLSNEGTEVCDLVDNDCDGQVDEDFDLNTNVLHCGQCGRTCEFPNATAHCQQGGCGFDPGSDCLPGYHDANGKQLDGCEYACNVTNGGVEICDGLDNDCNGVVDDMPVDAGGACNNAPGGVAQGACTDTGTVVCSKGQLVCVGAPLPTPEACDDVDNDCDGDVDETVTTACYTGPGGTQGVGICKTGKMGCEAGSFTGPCVGEVTPATEVCNNKDDDCDGKVDEGIGGGPLVVSCYSGPVGTAGVGTCKAGTRTCSFGALGPCVGEVVPRAELCGDLLDTDCDGLDDDHEGCLGSELAEVRLDAPGGALGSNAGQHHSFDLSLATGGAPAGSRIYAAWSDLANGNADIYFRRSTDGGATWGDIRNLTGSLSPAAVEPLIVVAPGPTDHLVVVFQTVSDGVRDIRVVRSTDGGDTFTSPSSVLDASGDSFHHHAAISSDGQTVALVWERLNTSTLARDIISRVSTNGGSSFAAERRINVGSGSSPVAGRPKVAITASGRIAFVWREKRVGATTDLYAAYSDDATTAIAGAAESRLDGDGAQNRASDYPQLAVVEDNLYVVWQDLSTQPGGGSDVVFNRSLDGGASWGTEQILDDPAAEVSTSFTPTLAVDEVGNRIFVAWEDRRQGTQIYAASSADGGATFGAPVRASSSGGAPIGGVTRAPSLAYLGEGALLVTYLNDQGTQTEAVFAAASIDGGATWQLTHQRMDAGDGPTIRPIAVPAFGGGLEVGGFVGWIDFRAGTGINGDPYGRRAGR